MKMMMLTDPRKLHHLGIRITLAFLALSFFGTPFVLGELPPQVVAGLSSPLSITISLPSRSICVGDASLKIHAILTNSSNKSLEVSPDGVHSVVMLLKYENGKVVETGGYIGEVIPRTWIIIKPHAAASIDFEEAIDGKGPIAANFFALPGIFSLQIEFAIFPRNKFPLASIKGPTRSNEAKFRVDTCHKDLPKK
jgi:hypothetical protein